MNILLIGNGFDLAHGLPTKYTDFLEFCKVVSIIYEDEKINLHLFEEICLTQCNLNEEIRKRLLNVFDSRKDHKEVDSENGGFLHIFTTNYPRTDELYVLIKNNLWIEYFLPIYKSRETGGKNGWIDFESEISGVIQSLDDDMQSLNERYNLDDEITNLSNNFLREKFSECTFIVQQINMLGSKESPKSITFKEIRNRLLNDLNRLIRALEIYLAVYVNEMQYNEELSVIKNIFEKKDEQGKITGIINTKILSFNYTETFTRIYKNSFDIDYIHGKANINNTINSNNMVLGIDEYLSKERRDKETEFIAFKKFYQRIHKQTGCKYKEWVDIIKGDFDDYQIELEKSTAEKNFMALKAIANKLKKQYLNKHHVYICGHSLDVTDKDILRDIILNDNVHITIFYHDKDAMGQQIANLVKVIGQDELIKRTGGKDKLIEFKSQKPMEEKTKGFVSQCDQT